MERERERRKWHEGRGSVAFFKKSTVTLSSTTKIFILENELTKKEIRL